ncbi:MAG: endonuclease/exonuclease/phosphatase family protein [Armatimonadota bacterium]
MPKKETLMAALTTLLGVQTVRAFLPLVVYVYGARPGVTSIDMGILGIGVFLTAALAAVPQRIFGPPYGFYLSAAVLVLLRLAAQFAEPRYALTYLAAGTVAFLWTIPGLLAAVRSGGPEATARVGVGLIIGLALDAAIAGAFGTWDPIWQLWERGPSAALVIVAIAVVYSLLYPRVSHANATRLDTDVSMAHAAALVGLGPILFLHMLLFHNPARLSAVVGWPLPAALLWVLAIDVLAVAAAATVRGGPAAIAAAVVLVPAAYLAHGVGIVAAAAYAAGSVASAIVTVVIVAAQGTGPFYPGLWRTAIGWGAGMLLFAVPAFLYYVGYDIRLPFENALLLPVLAAIAAVAALSQVRRLMLAPALLRGPAVSILLLALLLVPLGLFVTAKTPQAQSGSGWPVRVVSYNVHQGFAASGAQDLEAIARTIEAVSPDVVALQEVSRGWIINGSTEMLTWLAGRLGMRYVWGPAADAVWGNAILSRRPVLASGTAELPRGGAPMRRGMVWAEIDLGSGGRLLVIATHFHHVEADAHIRRPQAEAVVNLWAKRARTIVLGDLNATPDAREIAVLRDAGLRDAFALAGSGDGFTYSSTRPERRIDYIWVSPDLNASDFRVLLGQASDHFGIAVTVSR